MIRVADYIANFVANLGVKHVFGLVGGGSMYLFDAFGHHKDIQLVCNLHEQGAGIAAEAYAQYTNNLGVCLTTTGPGATNAITACAAAWLESSPVLFISGQVKTADRAAAGIRRQNGFQEINITQLIHSITKYAGILTHPEDVKGVLELAMLRMRIGRPGPVWIDVPLNIQSALVDETSLEGWNRPEHVITDPVDVGVQKTIERFKLAKRPIILLGNGVRLAGGTATVGRLLCQTVKKELPLMATWKMIDLLPHVLRPGIIGQRAANMGIQKADFVLCIGARLDYGQTGFNRDSFAKNAQLVIVDIDSGEFGKFPRALNICCDAKAFLEELLNNIDWMQKGQYSEWYHELKALELKYPVIKDEYFTDHPLNPYAVISLISDNLHKGDIIVPGSSGAANELTFQSLDLNMSNRIFSSHGLGSMGFGIPASIGAALASGQRVICIEGDGSFHMNSQELEVIRRLNLPIIIFVLNNSGYGSIRHTQRNYFGGNYVGSDYRSGLSLPDIYKIAKSYDIPAYKVWNLDSAKRVIQEVMGGRGPAIVDIAISTEHITQPRIMSKTASDGTIVSAEFDDMWPFIEENNETK